MMSFLNSKRPPLFCPGCGHERVVRSLDRALQTLGLVRENVVLVTDIGCSGLFDTFFDTHALHGLHGRALTYATGIKMVRPELTVIVIMGDGGLGIGGSHFLASCRRNLDINLLVLNNFNYGMTGGQCSATTPREARTASGFLNQLESPLDVCLTATSLGVEFTERLLATDGGLADRISAAIDWNGFSLLDIWGICPGRHLNNNPINLKQLEQEIAQLNNQLDGRGQFAGDSMGSKPEYGAQYRKLAEKSYKKNKREQVKEQYQPLLKHRSELLILGAAGQFINTTGEILALAAMSGGLHATLKTDYPITVLRGHSICEVVIDFEPIGYTGLTGPSVVICLAREGVERRWKVLEKLSDTAIIIKDSGLELPDTKAKIFEYDLKGKKIQKSQHGTTALAILAKNEAIISVDMLLTAIQLRLKDKLAEEAVSQIYNVIGGGTQGS